MTMIQSGQEKKIYWQTGVCLGTSKKLMLPEYIANARYIQMKVECFFIWKSLSRREILVGKEFLKVNCPTYGG